MSVDLQFAFIRRKNAQNIKSLKMIFFYNIEMDNSAVALREV
jgi:hypothetical protein